MVLPREFIKQSHMVCLSVIIRVRTTLWLVQSPEELPRWEISSKPTTGSSRKRALASELRDQTLHAQYGDRYSWEKGGKWEER